MKGVKGEKTDKRARVSYSPLIARKVSVLRKEGFTIDEIARVLGVTDDTLRKWSDHFEELAIAIDISNAPEFSLEDKPTSKYLKEYNKQAYKLCLLGCTNREIGDFFGVTEQTIINWCKREPEFKEALRKGKMIADADVADSLRQRAQGYSHKAVNFNVVDGKVVQTPYKKHYPPDTAAIIFWLKNRHPELWKDRRENFIADIDKLVPWSTLESGVDE